MFDAFGCPKCRKNYSFIFSFGKYLLSLWYASPRYGEIKHLVGEMRLTLENRNNNGQSYVIGARVEGQTIRTKGLMGGNHWGLYIGKRFLEWVGLRQVERSELGEGWGPGGERHEQRWESRDTYLFSWHKRSLRSRNERVIVEKAGEVGWGWPALLRIIFRLLSVLFVGQVWKDVSGEGSEGCLLCLTLLEDPLALRKWKCTFIPKWDSCRLEWRAWENPVATQALIIEGCFWPKQGIWLAGIPASCWRLILKFQSSILNKYRKLS